MSGRSTTTSSPGARNSANNICRYCVISLKLCPALLSRSVPAPSLRRLRRFFSKPPHPTGASNCTLHSHVAPQNSAKTFSLLWSVVPSADTGASVTPRIASCRCVKRFGSPVHNARDHAGNWRASTSYISMLLLAKPRMSRDGELGTKASAWAGWGKDGRDEWCRTESRLKMCVHMWSSVVASHWPSGLAAMRVIVAGRGFE